ncbi:MAG: PEP-CTERM sorting domain-containing protein [Sterolibacterium sp.]|nr:PEP-CTERM sorting domain-containing protein [Sterolibacterium sp.]
MATMLAAPAAEAAAYSLGSIGSVGISQDVALPESGLFSDSFSFSLTPPANGAQLGMTTFFWGTSPLDVPNVTFTLDGQAINATWSLDPDATNVAFGHTFLGLAPHIAHTLVISGSESSNLGQSYSLQIAAVPEPSEYAMMMAGLALVGMIARRKRSH